MPKRRTFLAFLLSAALSLPLLAGGQSYWPPAIGDFDASGDYLLRGSDLDGNANGKLGTVSLWFRLDADPALGNFFFHSTNSQFSLRIKGDGKASLDAKDAGGTLDLVLATTTVFSKSIWYHLLVSWDTASAAGTLFYINDSAETLATKTVTNDTLDYTATVHTVGGSTAGTTLWNGAMAELWISRTFLDLSAESNRRLFIDRAGFPVYLGITGQLPTGTAPIVYMHTRANNAGINSGTGGDFAIQGAPLYTDGPFPFFPLSVPTPDRGMGSRIH